MFSFIVGMIAFAVMGVFWVFRTAFNAGRYLTGKIIGKLAPSKRYGMELKWMTRDLEKKSILHTGMFSTVELNGGAMAKVFTELLACTQTFADQKKRRAQIQDTSVLGDVFQKVDDLYNTCVQQFFTAAEGINWKQTDIWQQESAALPMKGAVERMQKVVTEHEKMLTHALTPASVQESFAQDIAFLEDFNAAQQEQQVQSEF